MPNYYSPGVYIEEVNTGPRPIEAVATAVAAFVGLAPYSNYDDANQPRLITSWAQYVEKYGMRKEDGRKEAFMKDAYMSHAVYGYFLNGGTRCYVVRVAPPAWKTALKDKQLTAAPQKVLTKQARAAKRPAEELRPEDVVLTITPKTALLQDIEVSVDRAAGSQPGDCEIAVRVKMGDTVEEYKRIRLEKPLQEAADAAKQAEVAAAKEVKEAKEAADAAKQAEVAAAKEAKEAAKKAEEAAAEASAAAASSASASPQAHTAAVKKAEETAAAAKKAEEAAAEASAAAASSASASLQAHTAAVKKAEETAAAAKKAEETAAAAKKAEEAAAEASAAAASSASASLQAHTSAVKQAEEAAAALKTAAAAASQEDKETLAYFNRSCKLVEIKQETKLAEADLAFGVYYLSVPQLDVYAKLLEGSQPNALEAQAQVQQRDIVGDATERSGVFGLEIADDVTMVCCPDLMSPLAYAKQRRESDGSVLIDNIQADIKAVQTAMINHCELAADRIAILDAPRGFVSQQVEEWRAKTAGYDSMFAALYYPWITITNPLAGADGEPQMIDIPPCGHVAGIYARNDSERGVHKAPANEIVRGALSVTREITKGEQDGLNPNGINCIRTFPGRGIRVWGARTLTSDPLWRYVSVRRLFNMVEKSIERDTQWVVFEPNSPDLWSRVRRDVNAFLMTLWRDGMLFGNTPDQAFYVKCDAELNPPESRDLGRLIIEVGLAPVKPAEFVIFRFSQFTAEST